MEGLAAGADVLYGVVRAVPCVSSVRSSAGTFWHLHGVRQLLHIADPIHVPHVAGSLCRGDAEGTTSRGAGSSAVLDRHESVRPEDWRDVPCEVRVHILRQMGRLETG